MSYILIVNPNVLAQAGMPASDVAVATSLASCVACLVMGLWANFPFALAPGMGLNVYFTFSVVKGMGVDWRVALTAVLIEGALFMLFAMVGIRRTMIEAVPDSVKYATTCGIGLFLALIGLQDAGVIVDHSDTLMTLGSLTDPSVAVALLGLVLIGVFMTYKIQGAIFWGIIILATLSWVTGAAEGPDAWLSVPSLPRETFFAFDYSNIFTTKMLTVVFAFLFVDIFDTAGSLIGIGRRAGFLDESGDFPGSERAFTADAAGTMTGAILGTSTITFYVESAAGVEEGGRTGLTAVTVAVLFFLSLFFSPVFVAVPSLATAPALIVVGAFMMRGIGQLEWDTIDEAIPAFLTIVIMPFTYSIANGITFGIISYVFIKVLSGKQDEVHWVMYLITFVFVSVFTVNFVA
jgi:AGZA family xanthine/uracil permease-like MFS transporter